MNLFLYTVLQDVWIEACMDNGQRGTLWSNKVWAKARKMLDQGHSVKVLFRKTGADEAERKCYSYVADLVAIKDARDFSSEAERDAWTRGALVAQRQWIEKEWQEGRGDRRFADPETQFVEWELSPEARTWYTIENLRPVSPQPIDTLIKVSDGKPLDPNYRYGNVLCRPSGIIE